MQLRLVSPTSCLRSLGCLRKEVRTEKYTAVEKNRSIESRVVTKYVYIILNELILKVRQDWDTTKNGGERFLFQTGTGA